ncbi:hypothetical protein, variant 3 [Aphanomyces astaci]|uniref:Uncharacterized protein n=1 Tax=Aphanomyces astaci TaxID=112090 RepID=W4HBK5_APHAT|nr:hypothetical protein, variant 3 [Aphanomyces astaci]ETV89395.1 hypothetical protein, variant 3 [Aphanomyces astaci]|eukprot:XP_009821795.1 hypothetical protein, variant 3 [Aphanomyces astaci]
MVAEDGESLGRYASYGFVLSSMLHATGKDEFMATSEVYRWKLRCIRTKIRHQQFDDDVSFLRDVQVLLMCVSSQLVRESLSCKVLSSMATVGLGNELPVPEARHIPNKHVLATGATPTMPLLDSILRRDVQLALKQKAYSASALQASIAALEAVESPRPLDLSKVHPSLLRRTSSMIKPKKPADPSTRKPYVDGRRVYIPLEPEISDKRELKLLQSRRPQVEVNMCPHLQGQLVTVYSAKRDRFVSDQALGELRDGRVYDIPSKRLLTLERFFATHVRANRNGRPAAQHICLLAPTRQSLDLHLLTCDHYDDCLDGDVSSDVITDEDVPLSKLLEIAQQTGIEEEGTTPTKKRGRKPGPLKKALDTSTESVRRTSKRRLDEPSPPPRKSARSQVQYAAAPVLPWAMNET